MISAPLIVNAQVFSQYQVILPPFGSNGFVVSTTAANGAKLSATSTPYFQNGFTNGATSTGSKGFDISGGCFAIGGVCLVSGVSSVSGTTNQITASPSTGAVVLSLPNLVVFPVAASTTRFSVFGTAYFGGSATSTFDSTGSLTLPAAATFSGANLSSCSGAGNALTWVSATKLFGCASGYLTSAVTSVSGTANQITSSGGNTPTLSLPTLVIFPSAASTTLFSVFNTAYFGGSATSTFDSAGKLVLVNAANALRIPSLGTPAGTLLAADPSGFVIATTSSAGGVTSVSGTTNQITSSGGATPVISLPNLVVFPVAASTTRFSVFGTAYFGGSATSTVDSTGLFTFVTAPVFSTLTGIIQGKGASAATAITDSSTVGQVLRVTGASTYAWGALNLASSNAVTGILPIANGGTATSTSGVTNGVEYNDGSKITNSALFQFNGTNVSIGATTTFGTLLNLNAIANFATATSTFYSTGGINLTGGGCFAISGTCVGAGGGGGGSPGGSGTEIQYRGGASTFSAVTGSGVSGMNIGVGSTTPWAMLAIASTSPTYAAPLFAVATSSSYFGDLFTIEATSTTLFSNLVSAGLVAIQDVGARISIGSFKTFAGMLLDQLNVNGRINTGEWFLVECAGAGGLSSGSLTTATNNFCGQFRFIADTSAVVQANSTSNVDVFSVGSNNGAAGTGGGIFYGATLWLTLANNTPVMEFALCGQNVGSSSCGPSSTFPNMATTSVYAGFVNTDPSGGLEAEPTHGCYITASTTISNWFAVCKNQNGPGYGQIDTGIASTSAWYTRFRIEVDANHASFYVSTSTQTTTKIGTITGSAVPGSSKVVPAIIAVRQPTSGLNGGVWISYIRVWFRKGLVP